MYGNFDLIVFDVGANKGEFSEHVLRHNSDSQVYAFEPNIGVCGNSLAALKNEYQNRLHVSFVALGRESGAGELYGSKLMNGQLGSLIPLNADSKGWSFHSEILSGENSILESDIIMVIAVRELAESLNQNKIDFLKIDTQGTDVLILGEFFKFFKVVSGVVEVDAGYFSEGSRYETSSNRIEDLLSLLSDFGYLVTKILPNNSRSDELNVYFSSSPEVFEKIVSDLKLSSNPALARYWVIQGIGTSEHENLPLLMSRFIKKIFCAFFHPRTSFRSVLLKLTK